MNLVKKIFRFFIPTCEQKKQAILCNVEKHLLKLYKNTYKKWGGVKFTFYACWDNCRETWQEKPDFTLLLDRYPRNTYKGNYFEAWHPDRSLAIKTANYILKKIGFICCNWPKTRVQIDQRNSTINISILHE